MTLLYICHELLWRLTVYVTRPAATRDATAHPAAITSGIATQYLHLLLCEIGITKVTFVAGGGAKAVDMRETTMEGVIETLQLEIKSAVA